MHRPGLLRSAGVGGGLGPVHHGGVGGGLGLAVRVGGTAEGSPGGSVRSGRPGGSRVIFLGVEIQKPTERAVGIRLGKIIDYK